MEGCKETQCTSCAHRSVCKNTDLFLNVITAIDNAKVTYDDRSQKISSIPWIKPIEVYCVNYFNNKISGIRTNM